MVKLASGVVSEQFTVSLYLQFLHQLYGLTDSELGLYAYNLQAHICVCLIFIDAVYKRLVNVKCVTQVNMMYNRQFHVLNIWLPCSDEASPLPLPLPPPLPSRLLPPFLSFPSLLPLPSP